MDEVHEEKKDTGKTEARNRSEYHITSDIMPDGRMGDLRSSSTERRVGWRFICGERTGGQ